MASISWENWSGAMLGPCMAGADAVESSFADIAINSNAEEMASFRDSGSSLFSLIQQENMIIISIV